MPIYENWNYISFDLWLVFICSLRIYINCQYFDLFLAFIWLFDVWQFLLFISCFPFGMNIKITRFLISVVIYGSIHDLNYYLPPILKSLFVNLFTMLLTLSHLLGIMKFMSRSSLFWWNYYFFSALCHCSVLISQLRDIMQVLSWLSRFLIISH